eukprot:403338463
MYEQQLQNQLNQNSSALFNYKSLLNQKQQKTQRINSAKKIKNLTNNYIGQTNGNSINIDPVTREIQRMIVNGKVELKKQSKKLKNSLSKINTQKYQKIISPRAKSSYTQNQNQTPVESVADLTRRGQFYETDSITLQKKTNKLKIKTAQAQSDKLELMRDIATYEANLCEELNFRSMLLLMKEKVLKCVKNQEQHSNSTQKFQQFLNSAEMSFTKIQKQTRFSHFMDEDNLVSTTKAQQKFALHRSSALSSVIQQNNIDRNCKGQEKKSFFGMNQIVMQSKRQIKIPKRTTEFMFYTKRVSGMLSQIQLKVKRDTFTVKLSPSIQFIKQTKDQNIQFKISKKSDDQDPQQFKLQHGDSF